MNKVGNMIMVCGSGRNVGKTTLSCLLVKYFKEGNKDVYAIKTSSHLHELDESEDIICSGKGFAIVKEARRNVKDSSQLLSAGAKQSYYIQAKKEFLLGSFNKVLDLIPNDAIIVCESGGLREFIEPKLFLFVSGKEVSKNLKYKPMADCELVFGVDFNNNEILNTQLPLTSFFSDHVRG